MPVRPPRTVAALLALPLVLGLAGCGDDDDDDAEATTSTEASTTTAGGETTTTAAEVTTTTAAPEPENLIAVEVVGGNPVGGAVDAQVPVGEEVTIRVTADVTDEVHVHGYDLLADVAPAAPAEITFVADIPGQFEVELEGAGELIVNLTVS